MCTNKQTINTSFRSLVHACFKSLRYKIKVHQQLQMFFIHHCTSSGKLTKLNTANFDRSAILDQTLVTLAKKVHICLSFFEKL